MAAVHPEPWLRALITTTTNLTRTHEHTMLKSWQHVEN
jgi:hypothetical protein